MLLDPKLLCEGVGWEHRPHHCTQGHQNHLPGFVVCAVTVPLYLTVKRNHTTESSHTQPHAYLHYETRFDFKFLACTMKRCFRESVILLFVSGEH